MKFNKIVINASWIIICRIAQAICALIVTMITARYLGPSKYGLISYVASICTFFLPLMQLGLPSIQVQELINNKNEEGVVLGTSLTLSFISSLFCVAGAFVFASFVNKGETETIIVCLLYSILLIFQSIEIIQLWFQTHYLFKYVSIFTLISYIFVSIYKILLLATGKNIYWYAISYALDHFLISCFLLFFYRRCGGEAFNFSKVMARKLLAKSKYYIISNLMLVLFAQTDRVMLKLMIGDKINGYYSAAITIANMTNFFYDAIIDAYRPSIFQDRIESVEKYENDLCKLNCIIVYSSLAICIVIAIFAEIVVLIIYGNGYLPAVHVLRIVVWYTLFAYVGTVRNIWLLGEDKQNLLWKINLFGAVANVGLNFLLIPLFGAAGAAIASLLTQVFTNVVLSVLLKQLCPYFHIFLKSLNPKLIFAHYI